ANSNTLFHFHTCQPWLIMWLCFAIFGRLLIPVPWTVVLMLGIHTNLLEKLHETTTSERDPLFIRGNYIVRITAPSDKLVYISLQVFQSARPFRFAHGSTSIVTRTRLPCKPSNRSFASIVS